MPWGDFGRASFSDGTSGTAKRRNQIRRVAAAYKLMINNKVNIVVRRTYTDKIYCDFIRNTFRLLYSSDRRGRSPYYYNEILPTIKNNSHRIVFSNGQHFEPNWDQIESNLKIITDIIRPEYTERQSYAALFPLLDAFLQIRIPGYNSAFQRSKDLDRIGYALGEFLRDPSSLKDRYKLAIDKQTICNIYEYRYTNSHQDETNLRRVLALITDEKIDFIKVLDFNYDDAVILDQKPKNGPDIFSGFCIAGDPFSLIVLCSFLHRARHLGLLYHPASLIKIESAVDDEIVYESLTTNLDELGSNNPKNKQAPSVLFSKALDLHYGPRLRRYLRPIHPDSRPAVQRFIDQIDMSLL